MFPIWSKTLVAILFVLGFPVAMFLAWRFDIGPGGIKRTEATTAQGKLTVTVALLLLLTSTAGLFYLKSLSHLSGSARMVQRLQYATCGAVTLMKLCKSWKNCRIPV